MTSFETFMEYCLSDAEKKGNGTADGKFQATGIFWHALGTG